MDIVFLLLHIHYVSETVLFYICNPLCLFILFTEALLRKLQLFDKPGQIFNADETGISSHVTSRERAYGEVGSQLCQKKVKIFTIAKLHQLSYFSIA